MGTVKNIKVNSYCDEVNEQLMRMKESIHELQDDAKKTYGVDSVRAKTYDQHLHELADMIEWKLQLLMKACPFEWAGTDREFERVAGVGPSDEITKSEFSPGYVGG
jgi:hypothetical protein